MTGKPIEWYRLKMMSYGVLSMLRVLQYLEEQEHFEECAKIKSLLNELGFEGKVTEELINDVVSHHQGIWSKEQVLEANRYYSEVIINDLYESYEVLEVPPNNI